jgi:MFS family permease
MDSTRRLSHPWPPGFSQLLTARLLLSSYFFVPYIVIYAQSIGIGVGTLLVIEAVFALLIVLLDLPAAHLADRLGSRQVLILGALLEAAASFLLGGLPHPFVFWAVQPVFAAAAAMTMGADAGLAAGLLRVSGRTADFESAERLYQSLRLAVTAAVLGGASALSLIALRMPFLATGVVQLGAAAALLAVPDVRSESDTGPERMPLPTRLRGLATAVRRTRGLPVDLAALILAGTAFSILLYLMPVYFVHSGISVHMVGVIAAVVALVAALLAHFLSRRWQLGLTVTLAVVASALLGVRYMLIVAAAAVIIQFAQAGVVPRYQARIMARLRNLGEATAMSTVTTGRNIGFVIVAPVLGQLAARLGLAGMGLACAALFLAAGLVMSVRLPHLQLSRASAEEAT